MKRTPHSHECVNAPLGCTSRVSCSGEPQDNDGFPSVICTSYHRCDGTVDAELCEACYLDTCVSCERVVKFEGHEPSCSQSEAV